MKIHVIKNEQGGWNVFDSESAKVLDTAATQKAALTKAEGATDGKIFVHDETGEVRAWTPEKKQPTQSSAAPKRKSTKSTAQRSSKQ